MAIIINYPSPFIGREKVILLVCMCVCMCQLIVNTFGASLRQQQQCMEKKRQKLSNRLIHLNSRALYYCRCLQCCQN